MAVAQSPIPNAADGASTAVARMVRGILSYTRWPSPPPVIRFCVAGVPRFAARLGSLETVAGIPVITQMLAPGASPLDCEGVYLGRMSAALRARLIAMAHGQAIVTIDEDDPPCRAGAMFCLSVGSEQLSFQLNLDAISRGLVRIDPKVLRLARAPESRT